MILLTPSPYHPRDALALPPGASRHRRALERISVACASLMFGVALSGCAGYTAYREGKSQISGGDLVGGLGKLRQAMTESPENVEYRRSYFMHREASIAGYLRSAAAAIDDGRFDDAQKELDKLLTADPGNARAKQAREEIAAARQRHALLDEAEALGTQGRPDEGMVKVDRALALDPRDRRARELAKTLSRQASFDRPGAPGVDARLGSAFARHVTLGFANATLMQVFDGIRQASGLNFVFDKDVKTDARITVQVARKPVQDALDTVLAAHQLSRKVLDPDTLLIYPNTPQKAREHKDLVVKSFYLANTDIHRATQLVRTIAKARDVFVDDRLNLLIIRDHADVVRLVERLLALGDLADPEVVLDLEVLEVSENRLTELGIRWPEAIGATASGSLGINGLLTLPEFQNRNSELVRLRLSDPLIAAQLRSQRGDATLLANPRIRVRNRQNAKILIGERVPVITTFSTANVGTSESVNYLDVGLKLDFEPSVSVDDEVSMKVSLEVSNILETITRGTGTQAYRLGTRNASTTLRVRDNETQVLAGLIQRDERRTNNGVPGLNEIPLVNRLFGVGSNNDVRTEIVLLITPRIVRNVDVPSLLRSEMTVGPEASQTIPPGVMPPSTMDPSSGAMPGMGAPAAAPAGVGALPQPSRPGLPPLR